MSREDVYLAVWVAAMLSCGCGAAPSDEENVSSSESPIQGGQAESGFPAVGKLGSSAGSCTAELVAPSFILSAKHCRGSSMTFRTGTGPSDFVAYATDLQVSHPSKDLLLAHLVSAPNITPLSLNAGALPAVGTSCTAVGFGRHDDPDGTAGTKRSALVTVESATSTTIKVVMDTGIADHGDSGGPLLCGGNVAAVVHNHTDGNWPDHVRENYATIDRTWINANLTPPPSVNDSLYIVQDFGLWRTDNDLGKYAEISSADWTGATSMATLSGSLYVIQADYLHKVDPSSGAYTVLGDADWPGQTTMAALGSNLYITQDDALWKVTNLSTGAYARLGTANWVGATSMTSLSGSLYIIENDRLHKVNPVDGSFTVLGNPDWPGQTTMTALGSNLYITQDDALWKVTNLSTGAYVRLGTANWVGATSMTSLSGSLYIIENERLHKVNPSNGSFQILGGAAWGGPTVMTALP